MQNATHFEEGQPRSTRCSLLPDESSRLRLGSSGVRLIGREPRCSTVERSNRRTLFRQINPDLSWRPEISRLTGELLRGPHLMLSLGIDYDPSDWRAAAWDENRAVDLQTFTQVDELWDFVEELTTLHPAMPIVLPSGLGMPVTHVGEILDQDIVEMTLQPGRPNAGGLGHFLAEARRRSLRAFCIPAVKLLPTVPPHRKLNRLDLGASDALCAATWTIHCREVGGRPHAACDFVLLHTRIGTRSLLVVQAGRIVDGLGATPDQVARGGPLPPFASLPG